MNDIRSRVCALATAVVMAAFVAMPAPAVETVQKSGAISFVSGGVGDDSLERIRALAGDFNLQLLFAAKAGNYLADVGVVIRDARGRVVLRTRADGPFLLVKLPPGEYTVGAAYDGERQRQQTKIPAKGRRELVFRWKVAVDGEGAAP